MKSFIAGLTTGAVLCVSAIAYIEYAHQNTGGISSYAFPLITKLESFISIQPSNSAPVPSKLSTDDDTAKVLRVIDGDTIDVELYGERHRVRYISMNTPERDEPCFDEATQANMDLVAGGYAEAALYRPDGKHYELFSQLEVEAAQAGLGCHKTGVFDDGNARR